METPPPSPFFNAKAPAAFSLVELLVVVALVGLLSVAVVPSLGSLKTSGDLRTNISKVAGIFEQARQTAVSRNTYVYVGLVSPDGARGLPSTDPNKATTYAAAYFSVDGTDVLKTDAHLDEAQSTIRPLDRVFALPQLRFDEDLPGGNALQGTLIPVTAESPGTTWQIRSSNKKYAEMTSSTSIPFDRVIKFTPQGAARIADAPVESIEIVMSPSKSSAVNASEQAQASVIRISGLTGKITVHQPR